MRYYSYFRVEVNKFEKHWSDFIEGDNRALGELYVSMFEPLVFRAISYTGDPEIARDIVSQLFSELLSSPVNVRQKRWIKVRDPFAFLLVIVRNKSLDYLKVTRNRDRILKHFAHDQKEVIEDSTETELYVKLAQCVAELSESERELLELHLNGYKNAAIAQELQMSEKTVRNKLSLTRKVLMMRWNQLFIIITTLWN